MPTMSSLRRESRKRSAVASTRSTPTNDLERLNARSYETPGTSAGRTIAGKDAGGYSNGKSRYGTLPSTTVSPYLSNGQTSSPAGTGRSAVAQKTRIPAHAATRQREATPPYPSAAFDGCSLAHVHLLLEQRNPLRELHVLVGELGENGRVVEQDEQDEQHGHGEEHGGRVARDADPARDRVQTVAPRGEHQQDDPGREPEQRVPLLEASAPDELEDDEDEEDRRDDSGDRNANGSQLPAPSRRG